jgi:hypothetical protein
MRASTGAVPEEDTATVTGSRSITERVIKLQSSVRSTMLTGIPGARLCGQGTQIGLGRLRADGESAAIECAGVEGRMDVHQSAATAQRLGLAFGHFTTANHEGAPFLQVHKDGIVAHHTRLLLPRCFAARCRDRLRATTPQILSLLHLWQRAVSLSNPILR